MHLRDAAGAHAEAAGVTSESPHLSESKFNKRSASMHIEDAPTTGCDPDATARDSEQLRLNSSQDVGASTEYKHNQDHELDT